MIELRQSHWKPEPALYLHWQESINQFSGRGSITALVDAGKAAGVPDHVLQKAAMAADEEYGQFLYEVLKGDERVAALRKALEKEPQYLGVVAAELFGESPHAREQLVACECGGEEGNTSCYGCLRNYRNQFCHDELARGPVIEFLARIEEELSR